jgi:hypothetical protein
MRRTTCVILMGPKFIKKSTEEKMGTEEKVMWWWR